MLFSAACLPGHASLPQRQASLWSHLNAVNVQWSHQGINEGEYKQQVQFSSEKERVQLHLLLVCGQLRERENLDLDNGQMRRRSEMLDALQAYAEAGTFPQNKNRRERIPFFIDDAGTACAVGHLVQESGNAAFADLIRAEDNHALILDMTYEQLPKWAAHHGFSVRELAWIQPSYPITDPVISFPNAIPNGRVTYMNEEWPYPYAVIFGDYTTMSGQPMEGLVGFDGDTLFSLGPNLSGVVNDHVYDIFQDELWVGGSFTNAGGSNLAVRRSNGNWDYFQVGTGSVKSMDLYGVGSQGFFFGGDIQDSTGMYRVYGLQFANDSIFSMGGGFDGPINAVHEEPPRFFVGGEFKNCDGVFVNHYASSSCLGCSWISQAWPDSTVYSLEELGFAVHVAGEVLNGGGTIDSKLRYYEIGVGGYLELGVSDTTGSGSGLVGRGIRKVESPGPFSTHGFVFGDFDIYNGSRLGNKVAKVDFMGYQALIHTADTVVGLVQLSPNRYMFAGDFTQVNGQALAYLGEIDITVARNDPRLLPQRSINLYPNPIREEFFISFGEAVPPAQPEVFVMDVMGRRHQIRSTFDGTKIHLHRGDLPVGNYIFSVVAKGEVIGSLSGRVVR